MKMQDHKSFRHIIYIIIIFIVIGIETLLSRTYYLTLLKHGTQQVN